MSLFDLNCVVLNKFQPFVCNFYRSVECCKLLFAVYVLLSAVHYPYYYTPLILKIYYNMFTCSQVQGTFHKVITFKPEYSISNYN